MALVALPSTMYLPNFHPTNIGGPGLRSGLLLDVQNDMAGMVFQIGDRDDGKAISKLGLRIQTVGTTGDVDARVETVSLTDGLSTGTLATTNSNLVQSVSATGWNEFALTAGHVVAAGDILAVAFVLGATASASITTGTSRRTHFHGPHGFPYRVDLIDPGAKQKVAIATADHASYAVGFSDGTWMHSMGIVPVVTISNDSIVNTGAAEVGLEFQIPVKATLSTIIGEFDANENFSIHVGNGSYNPGDTGATRLSTINFDKDVQFSAVAAAKIYRLSTSVNLDANTTYRVVFEATTTTANLLSHMTVDSAALLEALGYGTAFKHILDDTAGGWTTTPTKLPMIILGFSKLDDGAGGGAASVLGGGDLRGGFAA